MGSTLICRLVAGGVSGFVATVPMTVLMLAADRLVEEPQGARAHTVYGAALGWLRSRLDR